MVIPEAQNHNAFIAKLPVATIVILLLFGMLTTIDFDNQFGRKTDEIDDVIPDRLLPLEFKAEKAASAQVIP